MDKFQKADTYLDSGEGEKALPLFHELAEQGRLDAMHSIAHTYLYGIAGIEKNYDMAFKWFTRAANNGCPQAMYHLGMCNANGFGTPVDQETATKWYRQSAEHDDEDAMYELAKRLEEGIGAAVDKNEAMLWYKKASKLGQKQAMERVRPERKC